MDTEEGPAPPPPAPVAPPLFEGSPCKTKEIKYQFTKSTFRIYTMFVLNLLVAITSGNCLVIVSVHKSAAFMAKKNELYKI